MSQAEATIKEESQSQKEETPQKKNERKMKKQTKRQELMAHLKEGLKMDVKELQKYLIDQGKGKGISRLRKNQLIALYLFDKSGIVLPDDENEN